MHMYSGILFSNKKNNAICSNMDGPRDYHISEVNQRKKDNWHTVLLACGSITCKIQMNSFTKQKQTHRHRKPIYGYQKGTGLGEG